MDKNVLKKFAIESRQDLMEKIRNKIKTFYVDENFESEQKGEVYILSNSTHSLSLTYDEFKKRELLIKRIRELSLEQVVEEAAYTWFNRIIAIRYMEINDILPLSKDNQSLGIRVLSSKDNISDPEILKFSNLLNPDLDIDFKKEKYVELKDENEKFKYILLLICKKLGRVIPQVFDGVTDYIDILMPDNLLNDTGFIKKVVSEVPEENYNQVEIIGWLYQYYNQTEKDRVISNKKIYKKNEIAYATQLFTPDWIVKYMVENSLGKYWIEHSDDDALINNWKYFIKDNLIKSQDKLSPNEITFIDPCCGSGHILVYAFEVLYQIYLKSGYNKNDISEMILKNNLFGLDIDDRAGQLSILSVLLKAREYDKNIFNKDIIKNLNIISIQESNYINESNIEYITLESEREKAKYLIDNFKNAKEIGSLLILEKKDYSGLINILNNDNTIFTIELRNKLIPIIKIADILTNKFDIVVTNPPYLSNSLMSSCLKKFINKNYSNGKSDLFASFMIKMFDLNKNEGYVGTISPYVWMFIKSYFDLRKYIVENTRIDSLIQLEYNSFDVACVPVATYVFKNEKSQNNEGIYIRLSDFPGTEIQKDKTLEAINEENCIYKYKVNQNKFSNIPGFIIGYWLKDTITNLFKNKTAKDYGSSSKGIITGDNIRFLRLWFEVENTNINFIATDYRDSENSNLKWYPIRKGGAVRKWYGNNEYIINWKHNGYEVIKCANSEKRNSQDYDNENKFKLSISWTSITISAPTFRIGQNDLSESAGMSYFTKEKNIYSFLALFNSCVIKEILFALSPTMNYTAGSINNIPIIDLIIENSRINELSRLCVDISREDWDSFEVSWNFIRHPLIEYKSSVGYEKNITKWNYLIKDSFESWKDNCEEKFNLLKQNEEELNRIFIDIYELQEDLSPKVEDKDITIRKANKERDIKSLISYAVGCMFGRYSLDKDGLVYAGGDFDKVYQKYKKADGGWAGSSLANYKYINDNGNEIELSFEVDNDNIIPITDEAYFSDDIVERFKTFIKTVYGDNTFNENMDFIAEALGKKGTETSEETIRRYFVNDFFNDHVKMYQKRPIYWLLDSGKKNGFKALVYMHRYNENLIPKARLDYLHRVQTTYEKLLSDVNYRLTTDLSMTDKKEAKNRQADLNAKLTEIKEYDEKIAHIANQRISIDLDDGVKVNYDKFKDILAKIK